MTEILQKNKCCGGACLFAGCWMIHPNIKTSVDEEFNILQTDVIIFCNKHLLEYNKIVQNGCWLNFILGRNCIEIVLVALTIKF